MLIQGKAKWAKVLGAPVDGYEKKFKEWSIDVYIDDATAERLKAEGLTVKEKNGEKLMTFKRKELKASGEPNQPIRVVDAQGEAWNSKTKIGNGSTVNVNFAINEFKPKQFGANILSLQVWDLVQYEGGEFPTKEKETGGEDWSAEAEA